MIAPLRARHRRWIALITVLVPPVALAALVLRPELNPPVALPMEADCAAGPETGRAPLHGLPGEAVRVGGVVRFEGIRQAGALPPGLLVYLTSKPADGVPASARLLPARWGACDEVAIPPGAAGFLLLYSAVQAQVVADVPVPGGGP